MAKQATKTANQNTNAQAAAAPVAPPAPQPAAPQTMPATSAWLAGQVPTGGHAAAFKALVGANAYLVPMPSSGYLHGLLAAHVPSNAVPVSTLPQITRHAWAAYNHGYLLAVGNTGTSYAACAAARINSGAKGPKSNPAFCYAAPGGALLMANGQPWPVPAANANCTQQAAYAKAQAAVQLAMANGALPAA